MRFVMRKPNRGGAVVYQASLQQKNNEHSLGSAAG